MLICARGNCDDFASAPRRLKSACPRPAVASSYSYDQTCIDSVVEPDCQQVIITVIVSAKRQIKDVHSISDCRINCVQDVLIASVKHATRENVVVTEKCSRRDPGHTIDHDTVYHCVQRGVKNSGCDPGSVRSVVLNGLCVQTLLTSLVIEDFRNNHLWRDIFAV